MKYPILDKTDRFLIKNNVKGLSLDKYNLFKAIQPISKSIIKLLKLIL